MCLSTHPHCSLNIFLSHLPFHLWHLANNLPINPPLLPCSTNVLPHLFSSFLSPLQSIRARVLNGNFTYPCSAERLPDPPSYSSTLCLKRGPDLKCNLSH